MGVIHDPLREETFCAERGAGCTLNGRSARVSAEERLDTALIGTGFSYEAAVRAAQAELLREVLPRVRDVRRAGAAALDLAWVAVGRLDGYFERGLKHWDSAAGALLVTEAGGAVAELEGDPPGLGRGQRTAAGEVARAGRAALGAILKAMAFVPPARHLLRAKDLADARYFEPLKVDDLARAAGLSRAHFSRGFRRAFGESPHTYLLTRRLERAAALLRNTDRSVADICFSVGLQSVGSFTTSFTRTYGMSPTAYRATFPPASQQALIPACVVRAHSRPLNSTFREDRRLDVYVVWPRSRYVDFGGQDDPDQHRPAVGSRPGRGARVLHARSSAWRSALDVTLPEMGNFRWLTVGPAGQDDIAIVLMAIPGPPVMDDETADQVRTLMAKGFAGTVFLTTDDCQASYEELKGRGVEFNEPPEERPYGIDSGFRDPSGNNLRLTQVRDLASL